MKFAKELEEELVPEWRIKYLDYKLGKKKIKAVQRAIRNAPKSRSPATQLFRRFSIGTGTGLVLSQTSPKRADGDHSSSDDAERREVTAQNTRRNSMHRVDSRPRRAASTPPMEGRRPRQDGSETLASSEDQKSGSTTYGSISTTARARAMSRPESLNLPEPAMDPASDEDLIPPDQIYPQVSTKTSNTQAETQQRSDVNSAFEVGKTRHPGPSSRPFAMIKRLSLPLPKKPREKPLLNRIFKRPGSVKSRSPLLDVPLEALQEVQAKQMEFWAFLDKELDKVETFYKSKEEAGTERLQAIEAQLHMMREQRQAIMAYQRRVSVLKAHKHGQRPSDVDLDKTPRQNFEGAHSLGYISNIPQAKDVIHYPFKSVQQVHFGRDPKPKIEPPDESEPQPEASKDYTRKPKSADIPYVTAKRKLKAAMQEFYRGLELLKSYALVNRTAFRKINKKYDKALRDGTPMAYMTEKVNKAWFVKSTIVDNQIIAVENLYAEFFEKGNHKIAVAKLRRKNRQASGFNTSVFLNGLSLAAGLVFAIEGVVYAFNDYFDNRLTDPGLALQTSYLLQVYAGYFLLLLLVLLFCLDCRIFTNAKVNYIFIFEFDTRHNLDWRQLSELPAFFFFLLGLCIWLNFSHIGGDTMYLWWPVVYAAVVGTILFLPAPVLYHESRKWFLYSLSRLLFPGIYSVEWRDFFLGDMLCSQTYSMGGIELFFCLYAHDWINPPQCNSGNSRVLGFLTTVPGLMRFFQCLRRYADTRDKYPHLLNALKYTFTILQYMSLSLYRIDKTVELRGVFIAFATLNSIMTIYWDIVHDWSLGDAYAPHKFLREHLAYKSIWWYYTAAVVDFILRWNWIPYAIPALAPDIQHSAILGFAVSLSEVVRRGIWTIFRVENEHVANVRRFKASRDVELPYKIKSDKHADSTRKKSTSKKKVRMGTLDEEDTTHKESFDATMLASPTNGQSASGIDLESAAGHSPALSSLRRRQQQQNMPPTPTGAQSIRSRVGTIVHNAHAQDFERRKTRDDDIAQDSDDDEDDAEDHAELDTDDDHHVSAVSGRQTSTDNEREESRLDRQRSHEENRESIQELREAQTMLRRARG